MSPLALVSVWGHHRSAERPEQGCWAEVGMESVEAGA